MIGVLLTLLCSVYAVLAAHPDEVKRPVKSCDQGELCKSFICTSLSRKMYSLAFECSVVYDIDHYSSFVEFYVDELFLASELNWKFGTEEIDSKST